MVLISPRPSGGYVAVTGSIADSGEMLVLQLAAFVREAQLYREPFVPPLTQTHAELIEELRDSVALLVRVGPRLVGAVRARVIDTTVHISRLAVAPDRQGEGIGSALLSAAECVGSPGVTTAELFTGESSTANLAMYRRRGYAESRREQVTGVTLIHLTKSLVPRALPR